MKELSIEEKAKAYDEIIERLKDFQFEYRFSPFSDVISDKFPELKESEDEKIRKEIIEYIKTGTYHKSWIDWLEKQGKKPNNVCDKELSEILGRVICRYINDPNIPYTEREKVSMEIIPYVERLEKQGEQNLIMAKLPQLGKQKTAWSEEDEKMLKDTIRFCELCGNKISVNWLKSLKERYTWKPSEEQLKSLQKAIDTGYFTSYPNSLETLYEQLKQF